MLREKLDADRDPVLRQVLTHPFWSSLCDGSLEPAALTWFVEQDTGFLLPAYARALARAGAQAVDDGDLALLAQSVAGTLEARDRLRDFTIGLAGDLGLPAPVARPARSAAMLAHTSFLTAASAESFCAAVGALLPMVWFNAEVSSFLENDAPANSRYRPWVELYHPGADYGFVVEAFLQMAERAFESASPAQQQALFDRFSISIRYELAFAESCISREIPRALTPSA